MRRALLLVVLGACAGCETGLPPCVPPDDRIFVMGDEAGELDGIGIPDADAFVVHVQEHLPTVQQAECE